MWRLFKHPNGIWYGRDRAGGRERRLSLHTKSRKIAEARLRVLCDRQFAEKVLGGVTSTPTLGDVLDEFLRHQQPNVSAQWYKITAATVHGPYFKAFRGKRLNTFTAGDIERFQDDLRNKGLRASTVNRYSTILGTIFTFAVDRGLCEQSHRPRIKKLREERESRRFFKEHEIQALFECSEGMGPDVALFIRLGILAGLRVGEILSLRRQDIDREHNQILICNHGSMDSFRPKSRQERHLPIHEELWPWLNQEGDGQYYFPRRPSQKAASPYQKEFTKPWNALMKLASIEPRATPHAMRHTFGTWLARRGCTALEIQQLMGHSSVVTTLIYVQMAGDPGLRRAVQSLGFESTPAQEITNEG